MSTASQHRTQPRRRQATARTPPPRRSSPTATCCSPSPTRCSARPPTPRTSCRRPGCGGRASISTRCGTSVPTWSGSPPARRSSRLRTLGRRKESYVGPWLPEPLLTAPDVAEDVELADSVSMAMLLVLETLTPTERAVFVLREVFDLGYDEIAEAVDKSPAAVRQIAHRARAHVAARRPRGVVSAAETRDALEAFQRAIETGDLQSLLDILAPDVVLLGDGGGVKQAVLRPIVGADKVARLLAVGLARIAARVSVRAGAGQWRPGADRPARRRDRHRRGGAHRRRPDHRALRRAQSREAVAYGAGDRPEPLSPGRPRVDASSTARGSGEPSRSARFPADGWPRSLSGRDERVKH